MSNVICISSHRDFSHYSLDIDDKVLLTYNDCTRMASYIDTYNPDEIIVCSEYEEEELYGFIEEDITF
jgi:hypothetical protein